ncbi:MAG: DUF262 domain-containing protein [Chitinophagaceae bacterium]
MYQIVGEVLTGDIRIPRFQRPGTETTWTAERRGDLLDSLYRGFPIGTILLWSTRMPIKTLDVVGGFRVRKTVSSEGQRLLLDGHQRLSTLVQILGPGLISDLQLREIERAPRDFTGSAGEEVWVFDLQPIKENAKSRDRFILLKKDQQPTSSQLPLSTALDRKALNRWLREQQPPLSDTQITEADALRDRLREYSIPVAVLVADSLEDATESFKRINSSGVPMSDFNMVAALAYQDGFDPQELFEKYNSELLEPLGWQDVPDSHILRVCAALAGQHPAKFEVDKLADQLRENNHLIHEAFNAVARAAEAIRRACGIHGPEALPYSWQLIILAIRFGSDGSDLSEPETLAAVRRWLWLTTYGEVFAGVNSAIYDRSSAALANMIQGGDWLAMERDVTRKVRALTRFDFRAARAKASALLMARYQDQDRGDLEGPAHRALAAGGSSLGLLQASGRRSTWWHLAVVDDQASIADYRNALQRRASGNSSDSDNQLLTRIGVPSDDQGSIPDLLAARRELLKAEEQRLVSDLGLEWADADAGVDEQAE